MFYFPRILHLGCGNSRLSFELHDLGFTNITNVDFSSRLIEDLATDHPQMDWLCDDIRTLDKIADNSIDVVIEKAVLESLLANEKVWALSHLSMGKIIVLYNFSQCGHCRTKEKPTSIPLYPPSIEF
jgi:trans-aconitate methyltransferase